MSTHSPLHIIYRRWSVVKDGTPDQVADLLNELRPLLRPLATRLLPNRLVVKADESDVAQLTTTRATLAIAQFNGDTPEEFWAWLTAIQRNEVYRLIESYRAARRTLDREQALADDAVLPDPKVQSGSTARDAVAAREAALRTLKPDDQTVIRLRLREGREYADIAREMGREYEAVKKLFARAVVRWKQACVA